MKILSVHLKNFASYKELDFEFDNQGLSLIHGATGSGKSTLCDAVPWCLFGITSKNGKADEVLSWSGGATQASILIELGNFQRLRITRKRNPNDLSFFLGGQDERGKDLQDTQKLINELLGMNADLYLAGAYYHEFSQTAQFFTTTPKNRRSITEQLVDLSFPIDLQAKIKAKLKESDAIDSKLSALHESFLSKISALKDMFNYTHKQNNSWAKDTASRLKTLQEEADDFETRKSLQVKELESKVKVQLVISSSFSSDLDAPKTKVCKSCGTESKNLKRVEADAQFQTLRIAQERLENAKRQENTFQTQIEELKTQTNPHEKTLTKVNKDLIIAKRLLSDNHAQIEKSYDERLNLQLLSDAVTQFRSELVVNTISDLETKTNQLLYNHFEGEITVNFSMLDTDKLDVTIQKDSNECSFTQLSKGQRGMLKLCFGIAVMKCIANHHSVSFSQIFFDEALDGLDDNNKRKAIKMLETLALDHDSVMIVEHSEGVKALIDQKYFVELVDGKSQIQKE